MDRQRAIVAGGVTAMVVLIVLGIGFVVGRASVDDDSAGTERGTSSDSEGLPAGPARLEDGVPVGFAHSEDGALSAAVSWVPWLISSPASERPDGIDGVLANGVEPPVPEGISQRLQYVPWAAGIEMASSNEATVSLWGTPLRGEPGQDLDGGVWPLTATLVWDDDVGDWRVTAAEVGPEPVDFPISASDVAGLRVVRFTGGLLAGAVLEEVPGD